MKPIWRRAPQPGDEYALVLANREAVDLAELKKRFDKVKQAKGGRRDELSGRAARAFDGWLSDLSRPLPSHVYALLSNWFLTDATVDRESGLGFACAEFWDALFAVRPAKRLTSIKRNDKILDLQFKVWWDHQEKSQGQP